MPFPSMVGESVGRVRGAWGSESCGSYAAHRNVCSYLLAASLLGACTFHLGGFTRDQGPPGHHTARVGGEDSDEIVTTPSARYPMSTAFIELLARRMPGKMPLPGGLASG